ncbi:MmcQ/YjbR family DNA-binding protein [Oleiharenicola lentus]|uniref:MmcQ/YjbR family DNA-binding protein n=1 Tax=Oleiharenicola lentus TaxID=2508720 RepID=UPI003F67AB6A
MAVSFAQFRQLALALPEVEERLCHDTPAFYFRKKIFSRLQEDREHVALAWPRAKRDALIENAPDVFASNDHLANYDYVLMDLLAASLTQARTRLEKAWRLKATKQAIAAFDGA